MDHVPLPHNAAGPNINVPFLITHDYDDGPLLSYPERHGWTVRFSARNAEFVLHDVEPPVATVASFVQTWLLFGLLRNTVGPSYRKISFVRTDEAGGRWLTTTHLQDLVGPWSQDLTRVDSLDDLAPLKRRLEDAERVIREVRKLASHIGLFRQDVLGPETLLALAILAETLAQVLADVCTIDAVTYLMRDDKVVVDPWRLASDTGNFDPAKPLLGYMNDRGWCPYDIARIDATFNYVGSLYYIAHLDPPRSYASHQQCSKTVCVAMQIIPASYQLAHTRVDCSCGLSCVELSSLSGVLRSEQLPLLDIVLDSDGHPRTSVRPYVQGEDFVSISHVWAEGLGNPFDNAVHRCELKRLSELTSSLGTGSQRLPIWLDTICVPVSPPDLHQLAMIHMRDPYRLASHVLVLDAYLLKVLSADIDTLEVFARVLCSSWMQRLWTLQEGRLGREVYFQFSDRAVSLREQYSSTSFSRVPSQVHRSVQLDLIFMYEGSRFTDKLADYNGSIDNTRRAIKTRAVSVAADEALCVACLLNVELDDVVSAPINERMVVLWRKQATVPAGLAFSKAERKLDRAGLRWAPESFLGFTPLLGGQEDSWYGPNYWSQRCTAVPSKEGLLARLPGALLHPNLHRIAERIAPGVEDNKRWTAYGHLILRDARGTWYLLARRQKWTDKARNPNPTLRQALFLERSILNEENDIAKLLTAVPGDRGFGVVHNVTGVGTSTVFTGEDGILYVEGRHHLALLRFQPSYQRCYESALVVAQQMLAERGGLWWRLDDDAEQKCRARAEVVLADDQGLRVLYEDWCAHEELPGPAANRFGDFIAAFGAFGDLLTIEPLPNEQEWCID